MKADPSRLSALRHYAHEMWVEKLKRAAVSLDAERAEFPMWFCPRCRCRLGSGNQHAPGCAWGVKYGEAFD